MLVMDSINELNNSGLRMLPCGVPFFITAVLEVQLWNLTAAERLERKS